MNHFHYKGDELHCEDVPLREIAEKVGTPTYVYSHATLERHYKVFDQAFAGRDHLIAFSVKSNANLAVLRALFGWGAGADIVSGGELFKALRAGCDPKTIMFSGVGKREDEIETALETGILAFNVESLEELVAIERVAARMSLVAPVCLRVNPDVDAETHPYISTGMKKNKFGISVEQAREACALAKDMKHVRIRGIDFHIGSQLTKVSPFRDAVARTAELARELAAAGTPLDILDVGGGLGIPYTEDGEEPPSPNDYAAAVAEAIKPFEGLGLKLVLEPGRVIVGNAGLMLTRVLYRKQTEIKNFVIVDAGFNDLLRPALYGSHHSIRSVSKTNGPKWVADVVGPVCETSDFLAKDREITKPEQGDLLAFMSAGAYGFTMTSNYNARPRPAEVLVKGNKYAVVRRREELEDLVRGEDLAEGL
jgi:diaminopimelate decarboxylase